MSDSADDDRQEAVEVAVEAASEAIAAIRGAGRRLRAWGAKEMLIASTAATVAIDVWWRLRERRAKGDVHER